MITNIFILLTYISLLYIIFGNNCLYCQDKVTTKEFETIIEEIERLTKIIDEMENKKDEYKDENDLNDVQSEIGNLKDDLFEISEILETVERKSLMDIIDIGAELRTRTDWFDFKGHDNISYTDIKTNYVHERVHMLPSNRLRLNMKAILSENFLFRSRLTMNHFWADDDEPGYPEANFLNKARIQGNIKLKCERAYIDYFFSLIDKIPMALSFGRIPTTDGLPTDLRENSPRKSTYPSLAYDVETDGIAFSILLDKLTHLPNSALRFGWMLRHDDNQQYIENNHLSDKKGIFRDDTMTMDDIHMIIAQAETGLPYFLGGSLIIFNCLYIPNVPCLDLRYSKDIYPFYYNESQILYPEIPDSLGRLIKLTFFIESKGFLGYNLDWFVGASYVNTKAKGALKFMFNPQALQIPASPVLARDAYDIYQNLIHLNPNFESILKDLQKVPPPIGLLNDDGVSDRDEYAFHIGFRFNINNKLLNIPKIGVEYNKGSKNWFGASSASEDPLNKLNIRGQVWDFYYIQPLNNYFYFRLGYTMTWHDYTNNTNFYYGNSYIVDHKINNIYLLMDARF